MSKKLERSVLEFLGVGAGIKRQQQSEPAPKPKRKRPSESRGICQYCFTKFCASGKTLEEAAQNFSTLNFILSRRDKNYLGKHSDRNHVGVGVKLIETNNDLCRAKYTELVKLVKAKEAAKEVGKNAVLPPTENPGVAPDTVDLSDSDHDAAECQAQDDDHVSTTGSGSTSTSTDTVQQPPESPDPERVVQSTADQAQHPPRTDHTEARLPINDDCSLSDSDDDIGMPHTSSIAIVQQTPPTTTTTSTTSTTTTTAGLAQPNPPKL